MTKKKPNTKEEIVKEVRKKEIKFTAISILAVVIILISSSYAIFSSVQKAKKYNTIKVGSLQINFTDIDEGLGNVINLNGAYPESDEVGQQSTPYTFKISNTGSITASYNIKLEDDTDMITADSCSTNQLDKTKIKYSINGETPNILSTTADSGYIIISGSLASGETKTYSLRVWIDESAGNEVLDRHYHGKIVLEGENAMETPNAPELKGDMIPVRYDEELGEWVKSSTTDHTWYDYKIQKWANAVTVTLANRSTYVKAKVGTVIPMKDINGMWVWIPRYSYTLGNTYGYQIDGASTPSQSTPGAFDIKWVKKSVIDTGEGNYTGDTANNYYTPSAFCWGNACDASRKDPTNEELSGIWVSKFEMTGTIDSISFKPNLNSVVNQTVSSFYTSIQSQMNGTNGNSTYGFEGLSYDVHMIKNSEWGVVAYLSQSKYGKYGNSNYTAENKEIYQNKSANFITGSSNGTPSTDVINEQVAYNVDITGTGASTTGNIYGIYDMSGGAWDYTMANYNDITSSSGFTTLPSLTYYNKYTTQTGYKGDATNADGVLGFYNDYSAFLTVNNTNHVWIARGGRPTTNHEAGIFCVFSMFGNEQPDYTTRAVIKP